MTSLKYFILSVLVMMMIVILCLKTLMKKAITFRNLDLLSPQGQDEMLARGSLHLPIRDARGMNL